MEAWKKAANIIQRHFELKTDGKVLYRVTEFFLSLTSNQKLYHQFYGYNS